MTPDLQTTRPSVVGARDALTSDTPAFLMH